MVILYTQPQCPTCETVKRALDVRNIQYELKDISKDEDAYKRVLELGYKRVPVLEKGADHWMGYQPSQIAKLV